VDELYAYIANESPQGADRVVQGIDAALTLLEWSPEAGRAGRVEGTRELVIPRTRYLAAYRIVGDEVWILSILHGSRTWPPDFS
jgi:toxin ParE1/3/4